LERDEFFGQRLPQLIVSAEGFFRRFAQFLQSLNRQEDYPIQELSPTNDRILAGLPISSGRGESACLQDLSQFFDFNRFILVNPCASTAPKESEKLGWIGELIRFRNRFEFSLVEMRETRRIRGTNGLAMPATDTQLWVCDHDPFFSLFQYSPDTDRNA
jgi:hypothetical protein